MPNPQSEETKTSSNVQENSLQNNLLIKDPSTLNSAYSQGSIMNESNNINSKHIISTSDRQSLDQASTNAANSYKSKVQASTTLMDNGFSDFETFSSTSGNNIGSHSQRNSPNEPLSDQNEGYRAMIVFGLATTIAIVYFYYKLRGLKEREKVHYGILDDREFELRHLSMSDDDDENDNGAGFDMRGSSVNRGIKNGSGLGQGVIDSDEDETEDVVYARRPNRYI